MRRVSLLAMAVIALSSVPADPGPIAHRVPHSLAPPGRTAAVANTSRPSAISLGPWSELLPKLAGPGSSYPDHGEPLAQASGGLAVGTDEENSPGPLTSEAAKLALLPPVGSPATSPKPPIMPAKAQFGFVLTPTPGASRSIGSYARGCLSGAVALPVNGPAWQVMRLSRNRNWGTPELIKFLEKFATDMQNRENWPGLMVGDLSQPRGGPMLTGHASHQIGLDVDIWYSPMPREQLTPAERETTEPLLLAEEHANSVIPENWQEGWIRLLRRAASYPEVARIFVHPAIKKALCQSPASDRYWQHKIRAYFGHNDHFHVRLRCPAGMPTCVPQQDPPGDDGCGKELDTWLALVSHSSKPAAEAVNRDPAPPPPNPAQAQASRPHPPAPPKGITLADMPAACTAVLSVGQPALMTEVAPSGPDVPLPEASPLRLQAASAP
jgi:penicillin-insensitive murein DD-endopeptidase